MLVSIKEEEDTSNNRFDLNTLLLWCLQSLRSAKTTPIKLFSPNACQTASQRCQALFGDRSRCSGYHFWNLSVKINIGISST
jgi:hypothetical protein